MKFSNHFMVMSNHFHFTRTYFTLLGIGINSCMKYILKLSAQVCSDEIYFCPVTGQLSDMFQQSLFVRPPPDDYINMQQQGYPLQQQYTSELSYHEQGTGFQGMAEDLQQSTTEHDMPAGQGVFTLSTSVSYTLVT